MHMQRELHPTLLSSLEGIVDQMVWFRENWHEEVCAYGVLYLQATLPICSFMCLAWLFPPSPPQFESPALCL